MGAAGHSGKTTGQAGETPSETAGRTAKTKVALPAGVAARRAGTQAPSPPSRRPPTPPKPWYRQGRFWFAVIVLEVVVAFGLSVRFMPSSDDVSLDGADLGSFCQIVAQDQSFVAITPASDPNELARIWGDRTATLRALQPVAPDDVRPDIDELASLTQGVQDLALDVKKRNAADPAYDGSAVLEAKQQQVDAAGEQAGRRFSLAVLKGCGVDLDARSATTVAPTPTTAGPTPGPTPAPPAGGAGTPTSTPAAAPGSTLAQG